MPLTYKDAGVDIDAGNEAVQRIRKYVRSTFNNDVAVDAGHFGGAVSAAKLKRYNEPVLVSSIDGVGTKLKVASAMRKYDTVGHDMVAHSVNDILCIGAEPLFFTDYIASSRLNPEIVEQLVKGLSEACKACSIPLVAGETAEMPGVYERGEFDLVGAITGVVERSRMLPSTGICAGDALIGIASSGLHTNGYSLARKVILEIAGFGINDHVKEFGRTAGKELLQPHKNYFNSVMPLVKKGLVKGIAHITGGGLVDNVPRVLPKGLCAKFEKDKIDILPVFKFIQHRGNVPEHEMWRTFNMGIGMVLAVAEKDADSCIRALEKSGEKAAEIGAVAKGSGVRIV